MFSDIININKIKLKKKLYILIIIESKKLF